MPFDSSGLYTTQNSGGLDSTGNTDPFNMGGDLGTGPTSFAPYLPENRGYYTGGSDSTNDSSSNSSQSSNDGSLSSIFGGTTGYTPDSYSNSYGIGDYSGISNAGEVSNLGTGNYFDTSGLTIPDNNMSYNPMNSQYSGTYTQPYGGNSFLQGWANAVSPFSKLVNNPIIGTLMSLHPATLAAKLALGGPTSTGGFLGSLFGNAVGGPIGGLVGGLGGSELANYGTTGQWATPNASNIGGMVGAGLGMASGNPYGAGWGNFLGQQIGGSIGNSVTSGGNTAGFNGGNNFSGFNGFGGMPGASGNIGSNLNNSGLGAIMTGTLGNMANNNITGQINNLQSLYGQNSAYAQQLQKQLAAQDAAAGRRSQYGERAVELQAALAGNAAKLAPLVSQLNNQKLNNANLVTQSLLRNPGAVQGLYSGLGDAYNGLQNLFTSSNSAPTIDTSGG